LIVILRPLSSKTKYMTIAGTDDWMAPEVILGEMYNEKADENSFGIVIFELITRKKPQTRTPAKCFEFDKKAFQTVKPADCPVAFEKLMLHCLEHGAPEDRPSFKEILPQLKELLETFPLKIFPPQHLPLLLSLPL